MYKTLLTALAVLPLISGIAVAQTTTSTTTSTQSTTVPVAPLVGATSTSSSQRTVDSMGVVTDKSQSTMTGTSVSPSGDTSTTRKSTETTITR